MIPSLRAALLLFGLAFLLPIATATAAPLRAAPAEWDTLQAFEDRLQWAAQESLATVLVRRFESAPAIDSLEYSRALLNVAIPRLRRRLFRDGQGFDALEKSVAIGERLAPPGDVQLSRGHWIGATFYTEFGQPEHSLAHADAGLRVTWAGHPVDTLQVTRIETQKANALVALGRLDVARATYAHALELREAKFGAQNRVLVPPLAEYGVFLSRIGEFDAARTHLVRALAIAERDSAPNSDLLEGTLSRLSSFEDRAGNVAESMELAQRAWDLTRERRGPDDVAALRSRTVVAYRLEELGDPEGSAAHLAAIVPRLDAQLGPTNPQAINARLVWIDMALAVGDTATARRELTAVRPALAGQERLFNENRAHLLAVDARLARARGEDAAARDAIDQAIALEWPKRDPLGETLASLFVHALDGVDGAADRARLERLNGEVARMADSTRVRGTVIWTDVLLAQSRAEARAGLPDAAWAHALEAERRSRERFRYELESLSDQRALQLGRKIGGAEQVLVRLAEHGDEARVSTAWDRVVRWRGLVGHEVGRRRAPVEAVAGDTVLLAAHARWVAAQRRLAQWAVSGWADPDDPETAARFEKARDEADEAERAYARLTPSHADDAADSLVGLAEVLARLGPDQALVAYVVSATGTTDARLGAFVARGRDRRPRYVPIGPLGDVEREIRAWTAALATPPADAASVRTLERTTHALGRTVRGRVWDPVTRLVGDARHMLLVPEGVVFELPWMALPSGSTRYLAEENVAIEVLGAEREWIDAAAAAGHGLLAVGGPDFDLRTDPGSPEITLANLVRDGAPSALRARRLPCAASVGTLPALPGARSEAEGIARGWNGDGARLLVGAEATERAFKREAPGRQVLHLATHGIVLEDTCVVAAEAMRGVGGVTAVTTTKATSRPASVGKPANATPRVAPSWLRGRVWLALAGANRPLAPARDENEGLLTAEEVVTLDLRAADWVVLSACQSGVAPTWAREGVLGMRRAFHLAGARSVIASQWPVADEATRQWMAALYAARRPAATATTASAGAALREACRTLLAQRRKEGRSTLPFYWAAFTATGI